MINTNNTVYMKDNALSVESILANYEYAMNMFAKSRAESEKWLEVASLQLTSYREKL